MLFIVGTNTVVAIDKTRTGYFSIYHAECDILITECGQCKCSKKYKKTLTAMLSRRLKDQKTHTSSHTTYANLSSSEKDERLRNIHQENKKANLRIG